MSEMETLTATTTSTGVTMVIEMIGMGPMFLLKIVKLLLGMVKVVLAQVEDMLHKMMRRFDASDEHSKELKSDLAGIGQKVDAHAKSIKHLELQMTQLSATVKTWQPGTLPSNTVQNPKK